MGPNSKTVLTRTVDSINGVPIPKGTLLQLNRSEQNGFTGEWCLSAVNVDGTFTYTAKTTNVNTGHVNEFKVNVTKTNDGMRVVTVGDDSDAIILAGANGGLTKYDGITGEFMYTFAPIANGNLAILNEDGVSCDTVSVSTVFQK